MKWLVSGYLVEYHSERAFDLPAHVTVHRLGTSDRAFLTPPDARMLAAMLVRAADTAEKPA